MALEEQSKCKHYQVLYIRCQFLGASAKLRKATISFVMSVCPSARVEQLGSHWTDIHEIRVFFKKSRKFKFH
jgi:hypothetical protein